MKVQFLIGRDGFVEEDYILFGFCIVICERNIGIVITVPRKND